MFKKLMYEKVVTQLNDNTEDTLFQGGYLIGLFGQGSPYVIDSSTLSAFDFERKTVIPVSEEYFTETPSVHTADRSDYVAQYQIMFQTSRETEIMTVMDEFRDAFFDDKQFTLDGYTVSIKTTRGEKQPAVPVDRGDFYVRFKINVYLTAIKYGYIWKVTDKWEMKFHPIVATSIVVGKWYQIITVGTTDFVSIGASSNTVGVRFYSTGVGLGTGTVIITDTEILTPTDYTTLRLDTDTFATVGNAIFSNETGLAKGIVSSTTSNDNIRMFYNSTDIDKAITRFTQNKLDKSTLFDMKFTFDSQTFEYVGVLTSGVRTRTANGIAIFQFDWIEADI